MKLLKSLSFLFLFALGIVTFGYAEEGYISANQLMAVEKPLPLYPKVARQRGWQGTVTLKVTVQEEGVPKEISVEQTSGFPLLDQTAAETIKNWKFQTLRSGNLTLPYSVLIPVQFVLKK